MSADVQGTCPACGHKTLFLGSGGYVTCRIAECPDPGAASDVLALGKAALVSGRAQTLALREALSEAGRDLYSIRLRCTEGDKRSNWLPAIDGIAAKARERIAAALAASPEPPSVKHRGSCRVFYAENYCTCGAEPPSEPGVRLTAAEADSTASTEPRLDSDSPSNPRGSVLTAAGKVAWAEEYAAASRDAGDGACACGWPEKPCLRRILRNGPPFPAIPCEPVAGPSA